MYIKSISALIFGVIVGTGHAASPIHVVTDIPPVHSIVSQVMKGNGEPNLLVRPGASPHVYSMHPSEAASLSRAELVIWIGHELTPWLHRYIESLASDSILLSLMDIPGTTILPVRSNEPMKVSDEPHLEGTKSHKNDHHRNIDPHSWLDPLNTIIWMRAIANTLADLDPDNSELYAHNAHEGIVLMSAIHESILTTLHPVRDISFIVYHDAYQYFENRFGLNSVGSIFYNDATPPSPAHLIDIRQSAKEYEVKCVFSEPQFNHELVDVIVKKSDIKTAIIDPLGIKYELGSQLYFYLISDIADKFLQCLE